MLEMMVHVDAFKFTKNISISWNLKDHYKCYIQDIHIKKKIQKIPKYDQSLCLLLLHSYLTKTNI